MRISDWSSDVCSSDLVTNRGPSGTPQQPDIKEKPGIRLDFVARQGITLLGTEDELKFEPRNLTGTRYQEFQQDGDSRLDRNSGVKGKGLAVRVGLGVRRIIKKKKNTNNKKNNN